MCFCNPQQTSVIGKFSYYKAARLLIHAHFQDHFENEIKNYFQANKESN
jgi:hypothetical protein